MSRQRATAMAEEVRAALIDRARPPVAIALGSPTDVARTVAALGGGADLTCYQMDLYQAERLRAELDEHAFAAQVVTAPDLWELPAHFRTVIYPSARGTERDLKIDMIEQAFHILQPHGTLLVWSAYEADQFFPGLLKKIFGRVHAPAGAETVLWSRRDGDRPRRRHELVFQARVGSGLSLRFLSRPGVFAYGRFYEGARALVETMRVEPGDRVLDVGCGCGTNGIFASRQSGPGGSVALVDSNVRAVALAELNARANGMARFQAVASSRVEGLPAGGFDVALANPPYFAQASITRLFLERSRALLRPGGRLYLVTKQPAQVHALVLETFGRAEAVQRRGYTIFGAWAHEAGTGSVFGPLEADD